MIYLYAIGLAESVVPAAPGLDDEPLGLAKTGDLAGIFSRHDRGAFDPEPTAAWRHDSVVEAAMQCGPVLPARFGTTFDDLPSLIAALDGARDRLVRQLEEVRDCVELAVRVSLPAAAHSRPRDGQEYVHTQLARRRERSAAAERTLVPLEAHALRSRAPSRETGRGELTASYLVRADAVHRFAQEVEVLARRHAELTVSCTGPWPPYSFVGEEER